MIKSIKKRGIRYVCASLAAAFIVLSFYGCSSIKGYFSDFIDGEGSGRPDPPKSSSGAASETEETSEIVDAARESDFEYKTSGGSVTINKYVGGAIAVKIPDSIEGIEVKTIAGGAFNGHAGVKEIIVPESVEVIGHGAFSGCSSIERLTLPFAGGGADEHTYIGYVFGSSSPSGNAQYVPQSLKFIEVGGRKIVGDCFKGLEYLEEIVVRGSVTEIESGAFSDCGKLTELTVPFIGGSAAENKFFGYIFGAEAYENNVDALPHSLKEVTVTGESLVGAYSFYGCDRLNSIAFEEDISYIGEYAFAKCRRVKRISGISGANSVGEYAFSYCRALLSAEFTNIDEVEDKCFYGCVSLKSVVLPEDIRAIGEAAFAFCGVLAEVKISEGVTRIEDETFYGCSYLAEIVLPDSVLSIGERAFCGCTGLKKLRIGSGVSSIGEEAFGFCASLEEVSTDEGSYADSWVKSGGLIAAGAAS